jgi:hypothetical protein
VAGNRAILCSTRRGRPEEACRLEARAQRRDQRSEIDIEDGDDADGDGAGRIEESRACQVSRCDLERLPLEEQLHLGELEIRRFGGRSRSSLVVRLMSFSR